MLSFSVFNVSLAAMSIPIQISNVNMSLLKPQNTVCVCGFIQNIPNFSAFTVPQLAKSEEKPNDNNNDKAAQHQDILTAKVNMMRMLMCMQTMR